MNSEPVQYSTAIIDSSEVSIDIERVYEKNLSDLAFRRKHTFTCPCCGSPMMAVLGEFRAIHFRHEGTTCDPNYYLHSTAEQVFYEEYKKCLDEGKPFIIRVFSETQCVNDCSIHNKQDCPKRYKEQIINLTGIYSKISPETRVNIDGRYRRPDLLLESEAGKQLWVEIWVSHKTEESKRKDGDILEIKIESKEVIQRIRSHDLAQKDPLDDSVRYYLKEECQFPEKGELRMLSEKEGPIPGSTIADAPNSAPILEQNNDSSIPLIPHSLPVDKSEISLDLTGLRDIFISGVPEFIKSSKPEWIDLGLPSGTLWSKEYVGSMCFDKAQESFSGLIPSPEQFEELVNLCKAIGIYPAGFIGPNGARLEIYEGDFWTNHQLDNNQSVVFHREFLSMFDKSFKMSTRIQGNCFVKADKQMVLCVRLTRRK